MRMKITKHSIIIIREKGDNYYKESLLWYYAKQILNEKYNYDLIKKCPASDGHLTSAPYYLRDRKDKFCLHDELHQVRDLAKDFMNNGVVSLHIVYSTDD